MKRLIVLAALASFVALSHPTIGESPVQTGPVVEIVMFKVSDPEAGLAAARAIVEDAQSFGGAVLASEIYQSASDPHLIAQRITWASLEEAKAAFAASQDFPNMARAMELMTEHVVFEHFYER